MIQVKEVTELKDIINEEYNYYNNLYSSNFENNAINDEINKEFLNTGNIPELEILDREICNNNLNVEQCAKALKGLANNETPGSDGITTIFL